MPFNIFNGSSWASSKKIKIFDGTQWNDAKNIKVFDGVEWKTVKFNNPENITPPEFSYSRGSLGYGANQNVVVSTGTWTNNPTSYNYKWEKAAFTFGTANWVQVGTNSNSLELTADFVGYWFRCTVTAVNESGEGDYELSVTNTVVQPETLPVLVADVISNGQVRLIWNSSVGASGYALQYQGPNVPLTNVSLGNVNTYTIDTGTASGTLGILLNPVSTSNPFSSALGGTQLQGTGKNATIYDLKPNKPTVDLTLTVLSPSSIRLSWTTQNFTTKTGVSIYNSGGALLDSSVIMQDGAYSISNGSITSWDMTYLQSDTDYSYYVEIYGSADRFTETSWISDTKTIKTFKDIPINGIATLEPNGDCVAGTTIVASTVNWTPTPTSTSVQIIAKAGSAPSSYSDGIVIRDGSAPQQYTIDASDVEGGYYFRAFASATTNGGTSLIVASDNSAKAIPNPPVAVTIPNFVGSPSAYNGSNYVIYYAAGTGTSNSSLVGNIASQSPSAGTYYIQQANLPITVSVSSYIYQEPAVVYKTVPNYVGSTTADGTYGDWTLSTNQNTGTSDAGLNGQIVSQSPIAGTQYDTRYVSFPTSISINRYQYQAPGYNIYVMCHGPSGNYYGAYTANGGQGSYPTTGTGYSMITGTTSNPNLSSAEIISLLGIPNACYIPPFGFTPFGFTPFGFTPFGFTPFGFTPFGFTPFGFTPVKSIGADTLVASKVPEGLVLAHNLSVGDVLYSANIEGLDLTSGQSLSSYLGSWSAENPVIDTNYETTITSLSARIVDDVMIINGNKYSFSHYILVKRNNEIKFVKVYDVLETDSIYSPLYDAWQPIIEFRHQQSKELVISINTEPYDVFFTDNAIVHDSHEFNAQTPGAISSSNQSLATSLEQLYQEWKLSQGQ